MKPHLLNRISSLPNICHRKACIRGMKFPVEVILDMLGSRMSKEDVLVYAEVQNTVEEVKEIRLGRKKDNTLK